MPAPAKLSLHEFDSEPFRDPRSSALPAFDPESSRPSTRPFDMRRGNELRIWHEALIDYMLLHPGVTHTDLARKFEVSEQYVGNVTRSDAFQRELAARRASLTEHVQATITERLHGLFHKSVDKMEKQLQIDPNISHGETRETMKAALEGLGYSSGGASGSREPSNQTVNILISKEDLANARNSIGRAPRAIASEQEDDTSEVEISPAAAE